MKTRILLGAALLLGATGLAAQTVPVSAAKGPNATLPSLFLEELTWTEVRDAIGSGVNAVIVPTGGTEKNGFHMIMGKHNVHSKAGAKLMAERLGNALVAPVLDYVPEGNVDPPSGHMRYAGTITLPNEYFMKVTEYAARSFKAHGFTDIVLLGDSGGNQRGLAAVAELLNEEWAGSGVRVHHVPEYYIAAFQPPGEFFQWLEAQGETPEDIGSHAGILCTAQLLAIDPSTVRADKIAGSDPANGVRGDPRRATAAYGEKGVEFKIEAAITRIREMTAAR